MPFYHRLKIYSYSWTILQIELKKLKLKINREIHQSIPDLSVVSYSFI